MINFVAIIFASVAVMALSAFWYSPWGFGKAWEKLAKPKDVNVKAGFLTGFLLNISMAFVLSTLLAERAGPVEGVVVALWLWAGFIATTTLIQVTWEGRSMKLWLIDNSYHVIALLMMGIIIGGWV